MKAPMKLVPVIAAPLRRLVIDTVEPLATTTFGYRHILKVLLPALKFPETRLLKELSSLGLTHYRGRENQLAGQNSRIRVQFLRAH